MRTIESTTTVTTHSAQSLAWGAGPTTGRLLADMSVDDLRRIIDSVRREEIVKVPEGVVYRPIRIRRLPQRSTSA